MGLLNSSITRYQGSLGSALVKLAYRRKKQQGVQEEIMPGKRSESSILVILVWTIGLLIFSAIFSWLLFTRILNALHTFVAVWLLLTGITMLVRKSVFTNSLERLSLSRLFMANWLGLAIAINMSAHQLDMHKGLSVAGGYGFSAALLISILTAIAMPAIFRRKRRFSPQAGVYQRVADRWNCDVADITSQSEGLLLSLPSARTSSLLLALRGTELMTSHRFDFARVQFALTSTLIPWIYGVQCLMQLYGMKSGSTETIPVFPPELLALLIASHSLYLASEWVCHTPLTGDAEIHVGVPTLADEALASLLSSITHVETMIRSIERNNASQLQGTQDLLVVLGRMVERLSQQQGRGTDSMETAIRSLCEKLDYLERNISVQERNADAISRMLRKAESNLRR
ncbi:hypothetical protein [Undibacterium sp. KW1]|uniref:hypothetical protein n=1 Tax=Undibacterium sp. KW1 TaxID=2058624 RepID=UPI00138A5EF9|nr:hypothetical protein [Undibacterium sp. KW1]